MFANNFLVGADPELVFLDPPAIIRGSHVSTKGKAPIRPFFGWDHNGYVVEPHPEPNISVLEVMKNLKNSMAGLSHVYGNYKWRAGAHVAGDPYGDRPAVTLGGHVHLDFKMPTEAQIQAFDAVHDTLVGLDILPSEECGKRSAGGLYGRKGDCRFEHGHMEYRSLCSWLFSRKASMLSMTAIKLAAVDPDSIQKALTSIPDLSNWLERFRHTDDDVRWIFERDYFGRSLEARPDRDIKSVWKLEPEEGKGLWVERTAKTAQGATAGLANTLQENFAQALVGMAQDQNDLRAALGQTTPQAQTPPQPLRTVQIPAALTDDQRAGLRQIPLNPGVRIPLGTVWEGIRILQGQIDAIARRPRTLNSMERIRRRASAQALLNTLLAQV